MQLKNLTMFLWPYLTFFSSFFENSISNTFIASLWNSCIRLQHVPLTNVTKLWSSMKEILPHFDLFITVISQTIKSAVSIHVSVAFVFILLLHQNHKNSNQNNCWGFLRLLEIWCCIFSLLFWICVFLSWHTSARKFFTLTFFSLFLTHAVQKLPQ